MAFSTAHAEPKKAAGKIYTYKKGNGYERKMEVFFPKGHDATKAKVPGLIMFHGGGWSSGSRVQFADVCRYFASRGIVTATVTYQLSKKGRKSKKSHKRVCIIDAKSAIRWYKENADELGIDPERIIAGGGSAGGHISLLATTNPGLNDPKDSKDIDTSVAAYLLFNPAFQAIDAKDSEVNFLHHLKADLPPSIVFFGTKDKWLKGWNPVYKKMNSIGVKSTEYWIAEKQGHSFFNKQPWKNLTIIESDRFLTKLGFLEGEPTMKAPDKKNKLSRKK